MNRVAQAGDWLLRCLVMALAAIAGLGLLTMMSVTAADVVLRAFHRPLTGAYDIVRLASAVTLACGLPYATAVKAHVAIEYFFHKWSRPRRRAVDAVNRVIGVILFVLLALQFAAYGRSLREAGETTLTLEWPLFWVPYLMAFSCGVVALVILHNLLHFGKEMLKP